MDALKELWWVTVMIGGPALIAVIIQKRKKRKDEVHYINLAYYDNMATLDNYYRRQDQFKRDDRNFKKIEEARNDFA